MTKPSTPNAETRRPLPEEAPDARLMAFTITPKADAKGGAPYLSLVHVCGEVDTSTGSVSLAHTVLIALAHRCPGQKAKELRAAGLGAAVIEEGPAE